MKKKQIILIIIAVICILAVAVTIYCLMPTHFLNGTEPSDIATIAVFNGNTGQAFNISDSDEIRFIVENIQNTEMKKEKLSIGYLGSSFRMNFYNQDGEKIESFIINSATVIRKDPFFYYCNSELCFDYLCELEKQFDIASGK